MHSSGPYVRLACPIEDYRLPNSLSVLAMSPDLSSSPDSRSRMPAPEAAATPPLLQGTDNTVFQGLSYAWKYEIREAFQQSLQRGYKLHADILLRLVDLPKNGRILEVGCGTGISAQRICEVASPALLVATDQAAGMLEVARHKFGVSPSPLLGEVLREAFSQPVNSITPEAFDSYLRVAMEECHHFTDRVRFVSCDAAVLAGLGLGEQDAVIANHVVHWFRRDPISGGAGNIEYEARAWEAIAQSLRRGGYFLFNTTGFDYEFADPKMNSCHFTAHPFYRTFATFVFGLLRKEGIADLSFPDQRSYSFPMGTIEQLATRHGYRVVNQRTSGFNRTPQELLDACKAAEMVLFERTGLSRLPHPERQRFIRQALDETLANESHSRTLDEVGCAETTVHYALMKL